VSIAFVLGVAALFPSYLYTRNVEKEVIAHRDALLSSRKKSGADEIEKVLYLNQVTAQKIISEEDKVIYANLVQNILQNRNKDIILYSMSLDKTTATSTVVGIDIRGKAATRESLLKFKKSLEESRMFSTVDLPLSDLAKSSNIEFGVKFKTLK
jgi:hypothetical protein